MPDTPGSADIPEAQAASQGAPASAEQVEDQDDQSCNQQQVNQTAGDVETEAQCPQNQNDHKDCPKHNLLLLIAGIRKHSI